MSGKAESRAGTSGGIKEPSPCSAPFLRPPPTLQRAAVAGGRGREDASSAKVALVHLGGTISPPTARRLPMRKPATRLGYARYKGAPGVLQTFWKEATVWGQSNTCYFVRLRARLSIIALVRDFSAAMLQLGRGRGQAIMSAPSATSTTMIATGITRRLRLDCIRLQRLIFGASSLRSFARIAAVGMRAQFERSVKTHELRPSVCCWRKVPCKH